MKALLLTGAYGVIGTNLSNALKDNNTLWALDIAENPNTAYSRYFSWKELDSIPFDDIDAVIHLAGKAHDTKNQSEAQSYFDINTELTKKVFDKFLNSQAKRFIFFSSVKAAADTVEGDYLTEDVVPKPVGPYGESKIAAEEYIQVQGARYRVQGEEGKKIYILRPCMIHGPWNKGNLNLLYGVVKKGIPYPLGAFENKRSFTAIDNLTFIIEQLLEKNIPSGIYNIADDETLSTNELIRLMARVMNKPALIWNLSPKLISWLAKIGTLIHLPLNAERLQKLTENYVVSNEKIKKALHIEKMPVSAMEGFTKTIKSFGHANRNATYRV